MSNFDEERERSRGASDDDTAGESSLENLWDAEGDNGGSVLHDPENPGFDNREGRDTMRESLGDPIDAIPRDPEDDLAPKKKSNLPFYGAVGAFAIVALGLVGYKTGLIGGAKKAAIEPAIASSMASDRPVKAKEPPSMIDAASGKDKGSSHDMFGDTGAKSGSPFDAEADLLADQTDKTEKAVPAAAAPVTAVAPAIAPVEVAQEAPKPSVAAAAPIPPSPPAPVAVPVVAKAVPQAEKNPEPSLAEPARVSTVKAPTPVRVAKSTKVVAPEPAPRAKVAAARPGQAKPVRIVRLADARISATSAKGKAARRTEKDSTPESKEVLAGWKLRGTWPNHGPSQLAWVADEHGRLTTVSVGARIAGARVLSIGKRGELVQTSAGQILP